MRTGKLENGQGQGEIAMGTLIPLGGGLFFPIVDFYHFDFETREAMASCLHHHYEKYLKTSSMKETFFHFPLAFINEAPSLVNALLNAVPSPCSNIPSWTNFISL